MAPEAPKLLKRSTHERTHTHALHPPTHTPSGQNGCACGEQKALEINYAGDVKMLAAFDFDAVKLDGCGAQLNLTLYAELQNRTGKTFETEK